ncbi:MAG: Rieske 2Fe-2S domain-containing protein [Acidimicrobiia bacterium]
MAEPEPAAAPDVSLQGSARARTDETRAAIAFGLSTLASIALAVVFWEGGHPQAEGLLLGVVFGAFGAGIVIWAKRATPGDVVAEERPLVASSAEEVEAFVDDLVEGREELGRRRLLFAAAGSAVAALAAALVFPIRSLGPRPGKGLKETAYKGGDKRLVREDGQPLKPIDLAVDGVVTVWPEGHTHDSDAAALLIHTRSTQRFTPRRGRDDWRVGRIVAYSKLCTHVGCPVGLYQAGEGLLLCPCHQSTFDVLNGARPVFGPAARSLPQLPIGTDDAGYLIARGDFSDPVGPGFWDRGRGT